MSDIEQRVKKIVSEQLGTDEASLKNESSFINDLGADSLDTVELVMALEEEFNTEIPDEEAEKITTVQQAIDYIGPTGYQNTDYQYYKLENAQAKEELESFIQTLEIYKNHDMQSTI